MFCVSDKIVRHFVDFQIFCMKKSVVSQTMLDVRPLFWPLYCASKGNCFKIYFFTLIFSLIMLTLCNNANDCSCMVVVVLCVLCCCAFSDFHKLKCFICVANSSVKNLAIKEHGGIFSFPCKIKYLKTECIEMCEYIAWNYLKL